MERVVGYVDDGNEILELHSHIDRLTPFIEEQSKKITDDSIFAERFAFAMNQFGLASKKAYLKKLFKNNISEITFADLYERWCKVKYKDKTVLGIYTVAYITK